VLPYSATHNDISAHNPSAFLKEEDDVCRCIRMVYPASKCLFCNIVFICTFWSLHLLLFRETEELRYVQVFAFLSEHIFKALASTREASP
jgi:hypothetical protein